MLFLETNQMKGIFETPKCQLEEVEVNARILVEGVTLDTSAVSLG